MKALHDIARKLCELKPLEETSAWSILVESKEDFLKDAENAGMVEGEHYVIKSDGSIWSTEWDIEMLDDYICSTYDYED